MDDRLEYLIASLDMYLAGNHPPAEAWAMALENYALRHAKGQVELECNCFNDGSNHAMLGGCPKHPEPECTCHIIDGRRYPVAGGCLRHSGLDRRGLEIEGELPLGG